MGSFDGADGLENPSYVGSHEQRRHRRRWAGVEGADSENDVTIDDERQKFVVFSPPAKGEYTLMIVAADRVRSGDDWGRVSCHSKALPAALLRECAPLTGSAAALIIERQTPAPGDDCMPNWLTKATGGSTPQAGDAPQTFHLTCECAEQHTGQRKGRPQRIICQTCGTALFVLPKNVYPTLKERPTRKRRSRKLSSGQAPGGRRLPSANKLASTVRSGLVGAAGGVGRGVGTAASATGRKLSTTAKATGRSIRASLTPFRLVALGISVMLLATAVVALRSHALEAARETFRAESAAGQESLTADDVVAARGHFALAAAAADRLGSDDEPAREVRRWHRETVAMTNLAPESLLDMLEEAEDYRTRDGGLSWADVFGARFEGQWIVLHAPIRPGKTGKIVDIPIRVGPDQTPAIVHVDIAHIDSLPTVDGSTVALFAAPLARCELDQAGKAWIVTLDSEAGFLWSHVESLRSLGFFESEWIDESEVTTLLDAQSPLQGAAP